MCPLVTLELGTARAWLNGLQGEDGEATFSESW